MLVHCLNPLTDPRWPEFITTQPRASIFHTRGWLEALRRTYGYDPIVYTTSAPSSDLTNGLVFCRVRSWLTGRRLVSVPFADHCDLLVENPEELQAIVGVLQASVKKRTWKYVEVRPRDLHVSVRSLFRESSSYDVHTLDLHSPLEELFRQLHRDSTQRKIRRAEREALTYREGRCEQLLGEFYQLHVMTRRRHNLPPQPIDWFRNLTACFGDRLTIHVASKDGCAIGSIVTLRHGSTLIYKYGASDATFHNLGTMPALFWTAIRGAKNAGLQELDLGRTTRENTGLAAFKAHLGATRATLTYFQYSVRTAWQMGDGYLLQRAGAVAAGLPNRALIAVGRLLYKHIG